MSQPATFLVGPSCTIADIASLLEGWQQYWPMQQLWRVDVSTLVEADGAGLQFLVGLAHQAHLQHREITWHWMPDDSTLVWLKSLVEQLATTVPEVRHD